jgi:hypothetical protein
LRFCQRRLQFVGNFHECHGGIIAARGKRGGGQVRRGLTLHRGWGYK